MKLPFQAIHLYNQNSQLKYKENGEVTAAETYKQKLSLCTNTMFQIYRYINKNFNSVQTQHH